MFKVLVSQTFHLSLESLVIRKKTIESNYNITQQHPYIIVLGKTATSSCSLNCLKYHLLIRPLPPLRSVGCTRCESKLCQLLPRPRLRPHLATQHWFSTRESRYTKNKRRRRRREKKTVRNTRQNCSQQMPVCVQSMLVSKGFRRWS